LHVLGGGAQVGVSQDGRATAGLDCDIRRVKRAAARRAKVVSSSELMAYFMGEVVDDKGVACYHSRGIALSLLAGDADVPDRAGLTADAPCVNVPDVIIGIADDGIDIGLILIERGRGVALTGERIGSGIDVNQKVVVGDELHADAEVPLVNLIEPNDGLCDGGVGVSDSAAVSAPLAGGRDCQIINFELRSNSDSTAAREFARTHAGVRD